jgi:uncharacterized protein (AIM24 family)
MAEFEVCELQGMRWVQMRLRDETVRAEAGALSHMQGDIEVRVRLPSPLGALKSIISNEALVRPTYTGTGVINLESSMGGYHPFEVAGESWILENGAYWASEGGVELGLHREHVWTSFWGGEGFIDYQTKLSGYGRVVLNAPGPVEEITLNNDRLLVEGKLVLARTAAQFQAYVPGDNVRVHTVGDRIFAVRVRSEAVDYRYAHRDGFTVEMEPATLPRAIEQACLAIARDLDLLFAGIDLKETPDGDWYCFEVNPCPGFLYYERCSGLPISAALADLLSGGAPARTEEVRHALS